jgi:hypothetical protein
VRATARRRPLGTARARDGRGDDRSGTARARDGRGDDRSGDLRTWRGVGVGDGAERPRGTRRRKAARLAALQMPESSRRVTPTIVASP